MLPVFNREKTCPKCGDEATVRYVESHEKECQYTFAPMSALDDAPRPSCHYYRGEHLHRSCRCGYKWAEAVQTIGRTTESVA